jgi:hypothetical protein
LIERRDRASGLLHHRLFSAIAMNWRGIPLTSYEVIVNSIAAATNRAGLTVTAELDTGTYPTGATVSDKRMNALPLARHDWHGHWNYDLNPDATALIDDPAPVRFDQPSPDLAWMVHPALTGMTPKDWDRLVTTVLPLHQALLETAADRRRGGRPKAGTGHQEWRLTLPDRLLATVLNTRFRISQTTLATLFAVSPDTINKRIRDMRALLEDVNVAIAPTATRLRTRQDIRHFIDAHDNPQKIK